MRFIFNSSMPRSGSELLQVILHQRGDVYGSPTSPLLELMYGARSNMGLPEVLSQPQNLMNDAFLSFCKNGMEGYYSSITDRPVVCDKSRGWLFYYEWLEKVLNKKPKIVCMVRDLRGILSSMERAWRKNMYLPSGPDDPSTMKGLTVPGRCEYWMNNAPVGLAMQRLIDSFNRGIAENVLFVRYEDLASNPKIMMEHIEDYLELDHFCYDFNNIKKEVKEDCSLFGIYGNHDVHSKINYCEDDYTHILGEGLCKYIAKNNSQYFDLFDYKE